MSRVDRVVATFVETIPAQLEPGQVYISRTYNTAVHACCCGCGNRVTTPTTSTGWKISVDQGAISITPSIGNGSFPCRSHYWIRDSYVRWLSPITPTQTARDRAHDEAEIARAITRPSLPARIVRWVRNIFRPSSSK